MDMRNETGKILYYGNSGQIARITETSSNVKVYFSKDEYIQFFFKPGNTDINSISLRNFLSLDKEKYKKII